MSATSHAPDQPAPAEPPAVTVPVPMADNPWRRWLNMIIWGYVLTTFTLQFFYLHYLLPTIGIACLYFSLHALRRENRWFHHAWLLALVYVLGHLVYLLLLATPWAPGLPANPLFIVAATLLRVALFLACRQAFVLVFQKAGQKPTNDPFLGIMLLNIFIAVIAWLGLGQSVLLLIVFFLWSCYLIVSLSQLKENLGQLCGAPLCQQPAVSLPLLAAGYLVLCLLLVIPCVLLVNHPPLRSEPFTPLAPSSEAEQLAALGFPERILRDLSQEDLALLADAERVLVSHSGMNFNFPDEPEKSVNMQSLVLLITMPDQQHYLLSYFEWINDCVFWNDRFAVAGADLYTLVNGALLYKKDGASCQAPLPRLVSPMGTANSPFVNRYASQIAGSVSYPFGSTDQRGYLLYHLQPVNNQPGRHSFVYRHTNSAFSYPYDDGLATFAATRLSADGRYAYLDHSNDFASWLSYLDGIE